jgi:hypothetical protein
MLEVVDVPQSCIQYVQIDLSIVLCMRSLLLVESFDLRPSNEHILVRAIHNCFVFAKMCLCQVSVRYSPRYLPSSFWEICTFFIWTGGHISLRVVNVTWIVLDPLDLILHSLNMHCSVNNCRCRICFASQSAMHMLSHVTTDHISNI